MPRKAEAPACPRCGSTETEPLRNYGKDVPGRFVCFACERAPRRGPCWFGPNNPADCGGTGQPVRDPYPPLPAVPGSLTGPGRMAPSPVSSTAPRGEPAERHPSPLQHALAELFLAEMARRVWTQRDVADRLGLRSGPTGGQRGVGRILHGKANPQLTDLERLLRVVGMRVEFVPCCAYHREGGDVDNDCEGGMTADAGGVSGGDS